jgi:UDP-GlcNAc:undecaprenyl-phosphate GlcNAc-1-phosphate transferase
MGVGSCFLISLLFRKLGIVDKPDGVRKIHKGEIALGGGLAIFLPSLFFILVLYPESSLNSLSNSPELLTVFFISIIILSLGLWDDIKPLPTSIRLIVQIFASWLVIISTLWT